ncbi:MAG: tetratricopeptide repeat protein [Candidatus Sulfotelmatobacter sp.]
MSARGQTYNGRMIRAAGFVPAVVLLCAFSLGQSVPGSVEESARSRAEPDLALGRARLLIAQGKLSEAERAVRQYLNTHSNSADGHFLLGSIYFQEVHEEAFSQKRVEVEDANSGAGDLKLSDSKLTDSKFGDPKFKEEKETKAKASLAEYTEGAKYRVPGAFELKVVAFDYVLLGDYSDADKWLTRALQSAPADGEIWYYLGRTKYNENRFEEAIDAFQRCLKLDPANLRAEYNLGLAYEGLGRTEDAAEAFRTAIGWQENKLNQEAEPFIDLGSLLLDENQAQQALHYLVQAVAIAPQEFRAHEQLGRAYERLGQMEKAQAEFEKAVAQAPQNPRLHYVLGQVYRKEGLAEKAKVEFDRSSELRRDSPSEGR